MSDKRRRTHKTAVSRALTDKYLLATYDSSNTPVFYTFNEIDLSDIVLIDLPNHFSANSVSLKYYYPTFKIGDLLYLSNNIGSGLVSLNLATGEMTQVYDRHDNSIEYEIETCAYGFCSGKLKSGHMIWCSGEISDDEATYINDKPFITSSGFDPDTIKLDLPGIYNVSTGDSIFHTVSDDRFYILNIHTKKLYEIDANGSVVTATIPSDFAAGSASSTSGEYLFTITRMNYVKATEKLVIHCHFSYTTLVGSDIVGYQRYCFLVYEKGLLGSPSILRFDKTMSYNADKPLNSVVIGNSVYLIEAGSYYYSRFARFDTDELTYTEFPEARHNGSIFTMISGDNSCSSDNLDYFYNRDGYARHRAFVLESDGSYRFYVTRGLVQSSYSGLMSAMDENSPLTPDPNYKGLGVCILRLNE